MTQDGTAVDRTHYYVEHIVCEGLYNVWRVWFQSRHGKRTESTWPSQAEAINQANVLNRSVATPAQPSGEERP
jgi:hypothetical protein